MSSTFFDYLTKQNPVADSSECKEGSSTKISTVYGPHEVRPWKGVTWQNLEASFGNVLRRQSGSPGIKDKDDIDTEKLRLFEEDSVTDLVKDWSKKIVQHGLDGTRKPLMASQFKRYLTAGTVHFIHNTGRGHMRDEKGILQRPDWCIYQADRVNGDKDDFIYLAPGDSKPAKKWQSEWIECNDKPLRRKATLGIQQLTKYMWLAKTRYGFIITEKELVPLRLSTFDRGPELLNPGLDDDGARHIRGSTRVNFEKDEWSEQGISLLREQKLAEFLTDIKNRTGLLLEYCRVPWDAHGDETLTINLTLWWLPMLALQGLSIDKVQAYKPLDDGIQTVNHHVGQQQATEKPGVQRSEWKRTSRSKRKAQEIDQPTTKSRSGRTSLVHDSNETSATPWPTRPMFTRSHRDSRYYETTPEGVVTRSLRSGSVSSRISRRRTRNKAEAALTGSFTSAASDSLANDSVAVSFASSFG